MSRSSGNAEIERLLNEYKKDREYPRMGVLVGVLGAADEQDSDSLIERLPEELRAGFEKLVVDYPVEAILQGRKVMDFGMPAPKVETVIRLREAFQRRAGKRV